MPDEMRKYWRFSARKNICATFAKPNRIGLPKVGQIVDMGMGGMALKYVSGEETTFPDEEILVELFGVTKPFITSGTICCRVVYDHPLSDFPESGLNLRRCGLQFQALSQLQSYNIGRFIEYISLDEEGDLSRRNWHQGLRPFP